MNKKKQFQISHSMKSQKEVMRQIARATSKKDKEGKK